MTDTALAVAITAEISGFRNELKKLGPIADENMKAVAAKLDKSIRDLEKSAKASARAGRQMDDAYKQAGSTFGKLGQSGAKAAGLLSMFSPTAAAAARSVNDLGDAGEVATNMAEGLGVSLSTAAAAVGALGAVLSVGAIAYQAFTAEGERQAKQAHIVEEGLKGVHGRLVETNRTLLEATLISSGATAADRAHELAQFDLAHAYAEATAKSRELVVENNKLLALPPIPESWSQAVGVFSRGLGDLADKIDEVDGGIKGSALFGARTGAFGLFTSALDGVTTSTKELTQESWLAIGATMQQKAALIVKADADEKARKATEAQAKAEKDRAAAIERARKAHEEAVAEEQAAASTYAGALDFLDSQIVANRKVGLSAEELADVEHAARLQTIRDQRDLAVSSAATADAATMAQAAALEAEATEEQRHVNEVAKIRAEAEAKASDALKRATEEQQRMADAVAGYWRDTGQAIVSFAGGAVQAHVDAVGRLENAEQKARENGHGARAAALAKSLAAERAAANEAFTISQGAQLALAGMNAVQAELNVLATVPYPATIPAAIAAGATAAADIVNIASQSPPFHAGGLQGQTGGGPDESIRKFLDGEAALSRVGRKALGDETINRANAGLPVAAGGAPVVRAEVMLGHRYLDRVIRNNARRRGSWLSEFGATSNPGRS